MKDIKLTLSLGTALALVAACPAFAQGATPQAADEADSGSGIADIIVTARKVSENLQTTPVAVSSLSEGDLEKQQITSISQLASSAPSLTFSSAVAQPGSATVFIRGQGSTDGLIAIDQAVGVYINGVYSARSSGGALDLVDVGRVEVLRGPQGTLFGRNTTGGAINLIANEPTDQFGGSVRVDYGNYDTKLFRGVINAPIAGNAFAVRLAYQHREHDGYGRNIRLDLPLNDLKSDFFRFSIKIAPDDSRFKALLSTDYTKSTTSGELTGLKSISPSAAVGGLIAVCNGNIQFAPVQFGGGPNGLVLLRPLCPFQGGPTETLANYVFGQNGNNNFYQVRHDAASYGNAKSYGASGILEYELTDNISLKSTSAWRGVRTSALSDNDGTPYILSGGVRPTDGNFIDQDQFSEELQLAGKALDNRLNFIVGGFYFKENGTDRSRSAALFPLSLSIGYIDGTISNKSIAGYGQFTYSLTDALRVTAGLRYTKDTRSAVLRNRNENFLSGAFTSSLQIAGIGSLLDGDPDGGGPALSSVPGDPFRASFRRSFNYLSYTLGLDWEASKGLFFYAKTSRANRSGGFNTRAVAGGTPPVSFRPERVTDYELGAKLDLLDRRVRLNLAGYYSKIDDIQRNIVGVPLGGSLTAGADNVGSAHIWGGEAELTVVPVENMRLSGSAGLTYPKYDVFINSIDGSDSSSAAFPYTPKQTYSINADYDLPIEGAGTLSFHTDYSYKSSLFTTTIALAAADRVGLTPAQIAAGNAAIQNTAKVPGYGLLNARVAFTFDKPDLEIALYARNIAKKEYITRLLPVENTPLGFTSYTPGDPRTYGVSATIKF